MISDLIKFPEILNGRVKTLHPKIHASLLYDRSKKSHIVTFKKLNFPIIDFVIVNLYPFEKVTKFSKDSKECIEMIDIGGPTMLRSAAKNFHTLTTISSVSDYKQFIQNIEKNKGVTSLEFRSKMAQKVFLRISKYDKIISNWFLNKKNTNINDNNKIKLKYGENPNQKASYNIENLDKSIYHIKSPDLNSSMSSINVKLYFIYLAMNMSL